MQFPPLSTDSFVVASPDQVASQVDGDIVILNVPRGRYYGVSGVGARVWSLLQEPVRVGALVERVVLSYRVDPDRCTADLIALLQQLIEAGLVERRQPPE